MGFSPRQVDEMTMGEFCLLLVDRLAEQGRPLPASKTPEDISHFKAVLADEWRKGNV